MREFGSVKWVVVLKAVRGWSGGCPKIVDHLTRHPLGLGREAFW